MRVARPSSSSSSPDLGQRQALALFAALSDSLDHFGGSVLSGEKVKRRDRDGQIRQLVAFLGDAHHPLRRLVSPSELAFEPRHPSPMTRARLGGDQDLADLEDRSLADRADFVCILGQMGVDVGGRNKTIFRHCATIPCSRANGAACATKNRERMVAAQLRLGAGMLARWALIRWPLLA
jgi:hypothetical protein